MRQLKTTIRYIKKKWFFLKGSSSVFNLQAQIYHSFSIIIIATLFLVLFLNLFLSLKISALLSFLAIILQMFAFYQSRFKDKLNLAIIFSCFTANFFITINYFFNGGLAGPTLLVCSITLFVILTVVPKQKMFFWFLINLVLAISLVCLEYNLPKLVPNPYYNRANLFVDNLAGYIINIIILYIGVFYIRISYDKEKKLAAEKTLILENLNSEKDKLFSIISHDFKTPLASIQQYLILLNQMDLKSGERKWMEANLLKTTTNTLELLTNMLQWSKSQMKGIDINLQPLNIITTFTKIIEHLSVAAKSKNINLNYEIENNLYIKADVDILQLILRNLLNNAIKFTQLNGIINVNAQKVNNNCIISIADNGVGMDEESQKDAFTLKIKSTYGTQNETGTGLGLVLCKEYTELQHGKIWFTSQKNVGTVFNIQFPLLQNL